MNTSIYLDVKEIKELNKIYDNSYLTIFRKKLENLSNLEEEIKIFPKVKDKKLVGIFLHINLWRKLNFWVINNSNENNRVNFRDALLTILEMKV